MHSSVSRADMLRWYRTMCAIRSFEDHVIAAYREGLFTGSTHPCICQEAIAVGCAAALEPGDPVFATYRGHGHAIAKGLDLKPLMAEILCRETGCSKGRGGSMHLCDVSREFWGTNAILAAHVPIAAGMALANKKRGNGKVTVVFLGDGATSEGAFLETLHITALWKLPLVIVCENNGYAISVPTHVGKSVEDIAQHAAGFGLAGDVVDGNDPLLVHEAMRRAVERARGGSGGTLLECKTVRWERHSAISAGKYENEEEAMKWKKADPIPRFARRLSGEFGVTAAELEALRAEAQAEADEALAFAKASPLPKPEEVAAYVYA
jgi:TPP-dependent pyruvate/acetoin dehydrogenase alpha subunit